MTWIPPEVKIDNSSSQPSWTPPEVKKKEEPVSVGDSESLATPAVSTQEEVATPSATLSFQEQQKKAPDFMGLISEGYKEQPSGVIKSVSEGLSKAERPVEDKFASYVDKKRKELTGGLSLPNPLTVQDPIQYQQQLNDYTRVLRENPMAVKEENKITAIRMLIDQTKNADRVLQDYSQQNIAERVGTGVKKGFEDYGRGYTELFDRLKQNSAVKELNAKLEALDKGEDVKLDEGDKILAQSLVENGNKIKQLEAVNPTAYNIGKMAGESLGFTGEFLLTGGVGAGLTKSITKGVAAKIAEGATVSAAKKLGVGLSAKMAQTGLQVAAMPTFYKGIAEDVSKGENFGESLLKNYYKTFSENFTERIFLKNPWSKGTVGAVDGFMSKLGVNMHTEKGLAGIFASTAEEVAEEKIGEIMTAPLDYNNFNSFWKDYWDVQKNGELIGSVAMMTVPMGLVSYSAKKYDDVQLNRIGKLLPSGIRSEIDQVLDDKKLTLKEQYDLVGKIVEDNATNKTLGDNPAEAAGNIIRYTQQKTKSNVVSAVEDRAQTPTVGTMEEVSTEDQAKLDYLESKGVKVPDGSNMGTVNSLYEQEKQKEPSVVGEEAKTTEIKPTEAISAPVEATKAEEVPIVPTEGENAATELKTDISQMSSDELRFLSDKIKQQEKDSYSNIFGENADRIRQIELSQESSTITRERHDKLEKEKQAIIDALPEEKKQQWNDFLSSTPEYDRQELNDLSRVVSDVESSENIYDLSSAIKPSLVEFSKRKNENLRVVFNSAIKKANELGIATEDLIAQVSKNIAKDFKDPQDAEDMVKSVLSTIAEVPTGKEQPTAVGDQKEGLKQTKQESVVEDVVEQKKEIEKPLGIESKETTFAETEKQKQMEESKSVIGSKTLLDGTKKSDVHKTVDEYVSEQKIDNFPDESRIIGGNKGFMSGKYVPSKKEVIEDATSSQKELIENATKKDRVVFDGKDYWTIDEEEGVWDNRSTSESVDVENEPKGVKMSIYQMEIERGKITPSDVATIIESAGLKVPEEIQQQKQPTVVGDQIRVEQQKQLENGKEIRGNEAQRQRRQERLLRVQEIDAELGNVWSDLADIVGAKISLTGEQRAKIMPVVSQLAKLYTEKYALKGMDLVDQIIEHFTSKGIKLDEETTNQISRQYAEGIRKQDQGDLGTQKGVDEGKKREIPVGDNGKDKKTPRGKDEKVTGETKQRGTQTSTLTKAGGIWERLAKEAPLFYEVRKESEAIANAVKWLSEREESTIQNALEGRKSGTPWERMDRRMIYMMYLKEKMSSFIEQGKTEESNAVWENIKKIEEAVAKEGTEAGWTVQALAKFKRLDDISTTFVINNEIAKHNQSLYPETDIKKVSESEEDINKLSKEIVNEAVDDEKLTNVVNTIAEKNKGKKRTETYSEKAKEIADKLRKVKSSNWGITLAADPISSIGIGVLDGAVETTAKAIELSGNIADSINKGINQIKRSDWYKGLNGKQKRHIERAFELNVKKDLGVDALDRATLEKYLKREMKDLGVSLKYIIKEHWANPTAFGTKLSDRIVANLGLTEAEAKLVEKTVNDIIRQKLEDKITNSILNESLPKSKAQKEIFLNKMGEFLMMGNVEHKYFREAFADKFGLTPDITAEQVDYLTRLNKAVDATKDMGVYGDIVANQLAQEIDKLIPRTKIQELLSTMVGLDYVNALSGYTTSYINIKSVFWNLLTRPIMDVTDGAEWIKSIKNGKPASMPILNAFNSWVDFFSMSGKSYTGLIDVLKSGDLRAMHKYISEVKSVAHLKVPEMERQKYGKDRFKPITVSVNGKNIDVNTTNYVKFVGRALAAQDIYSNIGFDAVELANALRKKMRKQGFSESQIKEQIQRQVYGWNLTEKEQKEVDDQLAKEKEGLKRFGFTTDKYKDNRRRLEIIREKLLDLEEQDILDLKEVAKGNVFNDARGGVVNAVMSSLSRFANKNIWTKLGLMPHFMFFKIAGNIGDFMIDTIPAYGSLRARGVTPTTIAAHYSKYRADGMSVVDATRKAIFGERLSTSELPFKTAMLGDKGSYRREQQLARARLGNMIMLSNFAVIAGLYAIGGDDKDENGEPWFDISGGRWDVKDVTKREQELMPPYTIKIGGYKFRYGNAPILTFGMSMVGNYRDMINAGASDEEAMQRMKLMSRSYAYSIASLTDQQLMQGFKSITQSISELWKTGVDIKKEDETGESQAAQKIAEKFGKYIVKEQLSPFTGWLPTKNNAFQQSIQFISKKAVENKDIPSMLAYDLGIHQFTNRTALDRFGDDVKRKPGYTGIYWEPEMITSDPKKWDMVRWLQTNNAFPASYYNRDERFVYDTPKSKGWLHDLMGDKKPVVESKAPTEDQFYEMRKLEGNMLKKDLMRYKDATYEGKPIWEREAKEQLSSGETVMQQKIKKYIAEAKQQTKLYLFTWADIGKKDPALFKQLYESKSLPQYETKVPVYKRNLDGSMYVDENGEYVVRDKQELVSDQLALFNAEAFRYYIDLMKQMKTTDPNQLNQLSKDMWKVAVQTKAAEYKGE